MRKIAIPISQNIKEIRTYNDYTQRFLASVLNINRSTYADWELNRKIIPLKHLNKLANFYELNIDYILGLTNEIRPIKKTDLKIEIISSNFLKVRRENNLSTRELAKLLNIGNSTITDYENKKYFISTSVCYDLARRFNISIDWLLGKSSIKKL